MNFVYEMYKLNSSDDLNHESTFDNDNQKPNKCWKEAIIVVEICLFI